MAMDAITPKNEIARAENVKRPSREEAEEAVRTLIAWADCRSQLPATVPSAWGVSRNRNGNYNSICNQNHDYNYH